MTKQDVSQWEYCAVVGVFNSYHNRQLAPRYPAIWYFTPDGIRVVEIKGRDPNEVTRTIARLGEEGWEMAGCGNLEVAEHAIYFKRPKVEATIHGRGGNDHQLESEVLNSSHP